MFVDVIFFYKLDRCEGFLTRILVDSKLFLASMKFILNK